MVVDFAQINISVVVWDIIYFIGLWSINMVLISKYVDTTDFDIRVVFLFNYRCNNIMHNV